MSFKNCCCYRRIQKSNIFSETQKTLSSSSFPNHHHHQHFRPLIKPDDQSIFIWMKRKKTPDIERLNKNISEKVLAMEKCRSISKMGKINEENLLAFFIFFFFFDNITQLPHTHTYTMVTMILVFQGVLFCLVGRCFWWMVDKCVKAPSIHPSRQSFS